jgi:NCS2 family nucleobase:cation symporter-2
MITARLLDPRKVIVIGFSFAMAVMADVYHDVFVKLPILLQPIFGNSLVLGTFCAVLLNLIMRIGVRQRVTMKLDAGHVDRDTIERFLTEQGGRWGARRDIISRAIFGVVQVLEVVGDIPEGTEIEASFDEFNLDVKIKYKGAPLIIPERKPTPREIIANEDGERLLAGYLLSQSADRINCKASGTMAEVQLHYDH